MPEELWPQVLIIPRQRQWWLPEWFVTSQESTGKVQPQGLSPGSTHPDCTCNLKTEIETMLIFFPSLLKTSPWYNEQKQAKMMVQAQNGISLIRDLNLWNFFRKLLPASCTIRNLYIYTWSVWHDLHLWPSPSTARHRARLQLFFSLLLQIRPHWVFSYRAICG